MRTRQFNSCLMPDCAEAYVFGSNDLREAIRPVVRKALRKMFPSAETEETSIAAIVGYEFQQPLGDTEPLEPQLGAMDYTVAARRQVHSERPRQNPMKVQFRRHT